MRSPNRYVLIVFGTSTIAVGAWLKFNVGPVPYTFQNFGVVLASLVLNPASAAMSVILYILMIFLGLPVGAGFSGGPHLLFGYTAGYIWGFLLSAPIISALTRTYLKISNRRLHELRAKDIVFLTALASIGMLPTYVLGYTVFRYHALSSVGLLDWAKATSKLLCFYGSPELVILIATIIVFIPQDVLMDHLLAVITSKKLCYLLSSRGVKTGEGSMC
ncbi:MAG: biotin transporter BioY [Sulfolobales archaeon]